MFVPLNRGGAKGWMFDLVCPGNAMSVSHHKRLLLLKSSTVNRNLSVGDVCTDKYVFVAYNNRPPTTFEVSSITGKMVRFPVKPVLRYESVAKEWEIQAAFFESNNIIPNWIYANQTWGTLNKTTGQWSGAVGLIQRDEADYAITGFAGTHPIYSFINHLFTSFDISKVLMSTLYTLTVGCVWENIPQGQPRVVFSKIN